MQRTPPCAVGVPQSLDGLRPLRDFVNLVEHQDAALRQPFRIEPGPLPMAHQPAGASFLSGGNRDVVRIRVHEADSRRIGFIYRKVVVGRAQHRARDGALAGLPRAEQSNDPVRRLAQAGFQSRELCTMVRHYPLPVVRRSAAAGRPGSRRAARLRPRGSLRAAMPHWQARCPRIGRRSSCATIPRPAAGAVDPAAHRRLP